MMRLRVPVICVIIGEGASGGVALGIGVGDKVYMLENSWYTGHLTGKLQFDPVAELGPEGKGSRGITAYARQYV